MSAPTFEQALEAVSRRLTGEAREHSLRVSETAGIIASRYGVDVDDARLAGLLHDWDRSESGSALLAKARQADLEVGHVDEQVPYLLHARTARASLDDELEGLPSHVLDAVERHTMGAPEMTELDKVVYIADMLEPSRTFEGVDELRLIVGEVTLDELFARSYAMSITHLIRTRRKIHPLTVAVWNAHVAEDGS